MNTNSDNVDDLITREDLYYWIYIAIFGVLWGLGTSVAAGTLPPEPITRVIVIGWIDLIILSLAKLILLKPYCVTHAILIASFIAIFTFSFGPPNPYKPLFVIAGLAFDAGTLFRTSNLRYWNFALGFILYAPVVFAVFAGILFLVAPSSIDSFLDLVPIATGIYLVEGILASFIFWQFINPNEYPDFVRRIRERVGAAT